VTKNDSFCSLFIFRFPPGCLAFYTSEGGNMMETIVYTLVKRGYKFTCYEKFDPKETVPCQALKTRIVKEKIVEETA